MMGLREKRSNLQAQSVTLSQEFHSGLRIGNIFPLKVAWELLT